MFKTNISILFLVLILFSGMVYPLRAHAVLGIVDLNIDLAEVGTWIVDNVLQTILQTLKHRLLSMATNRIIEYIQGNGDPKFIKNFDGVLEDSFQAAVGDTAIELGASELCYEDLRFQLKFDMQQPVFRERVQCTLDDIVENIEAFGDNFQDGGWIAYQESLKPQNNPQGIKFLTQQEVMNKQEEKETVSKLEVSNSGGFLNSKRCTEWVAKNDGAVASGNETYNQGFSVTSGHEEFNYTETPDGYSWNGREDSPLGSDWKCSNTEIVTPSQISKSITTKALGSDIDALLNTEGVGSYIAAIINAGINRLTRETVNGLTYLTSGDKSAKCSELEGGERAACYAAKSAANAADEVKGALKDKMAKEEQTEKLEGAIDDFERNRDLINTTSTEDFVDQKVENLQELRSELETKHANYSNDSISLTSASTTLHEAKEVNEEAFSMTTTTEGLISCREEVLESLENDGEASSEEIIAAESKLEKAELYLSNIESDKALIRNKFNSIDLYMNDWNSVLVEIDNRYDYDVSHVTSTIESGESFRLQKYQSDFYDLIEEVRNISSDVETIKARVEEREETIDLKLSSCNGLLND